MISGFVLLDKSMTKHIVLQRCSTRNVFSLGQQKVSIDKTQRWCKLVVGLRNC